jgi:hypothetical protein
VDGLTPATEFVVLHMFRKGAVIEKINLQREGNMVKPYQVKQVRNVIVKYKLGGTVDV